MALRTRSIGARRLLAHAATDGSASLEQLLTAAHRGHRVYPIRGARIDPSSLADLARVIALQNVLNRDRADGFALYEMGLELFGAGALSPKHQGTHVQLAYALGEYSRAQSLMDAYAQMPQEVRSAVTLDLTNPFIFEDSRSIDEWLGHFTELLPDCRLTVKEGKEACLDRLRSAIAGSVQAEHQVSVIVTCYMPGQGLLTAVRSLLAQSWRNLEVLVVDDGSPPEYDRVLSQCEALDERVTVIRIEVNAGTYNARNTALEIAAGDLVTFQDSDDWSHPGRIDRQAEVLLDDPEIVATVADALRVTDSLGLTRPGAHPQGEAAATLMFRTRPVRDRIGYFDSVRKGGDNEYIRRIQATFGDGALHRLRGKPVGLVRRAPGSLSREEFAPGWAHPARGAYWSAYGAWHRSIRRGSASPFLPRKPEHRPFFAPRHLRDWRDDLSGKTYDVILVDDWRVGRVNEEALEKIIALIERRLSVAVMQMESFRHLRECWKPTSAALQHLINNGSIDQVVITDQVDAHLLVVGDPSVLQFAARTPRCRVSAGQVVIVVSSVPGDHRGDAYDHESCSLAAQELFGPKPRWCPQFSIIRQCLEASPVSADVAAFDLPPVIDAAAWNLDRTRFRSRRPVIGMRSDGDSATWPADRASVLELYPNSPRVDVRIQGDVDGARRALGSQNLPSNWLVYDNEEIDVRCFLSQLECYICFPRAAPSVTSRHTIIQAMASGCTVILPPELSADFGDGAVYCRPAEAQELAWTYCSRWDMFRAQANRARALVRARFSHRAHYERVARALSQRIGTAAE